MARRAIKAAGLGAAALSITVTIGLTSADATRIVKIASHISIRSEQLRFSGRVTSANSACESQRKVTLYRTNGDVLGSTKTGRHGHWKITAQGSAGITMGHFYAKVKRTSQGTAGTIYVCKAARSRTIAYHR